MNNLFIPLMIEEKDLYFMCEEKHVDINEWVLLLKLKNYNLR